MTTVIADPIAAARELAPTIRGFGDEIDAGRRLPDALVKELQRAGLFRIALPAWVGGSEQSPVVVARVVEEVAKADGSAAWCVMLAGQAAATAGLMAPEVAREVFGAEPGGILAQVARPIGTATPVDGGYRVSGRWPFASGSSHATWFAGECTLDNPGGDPLIRLAIVPRAEVTVHDNWDTHGMRGSASGDFSVNDVFVPASRMVEMAESADAAAWGPYRCMPLIFIGHGSALLGVAAGMLDDFIDLAGKKGGWGTAKTLAEMGRVQTAAARARAEIESARRYLYGTAEDLWAEVDAGGPGSPQQRAELRLAICHAATASMRALEAVADAAGTSFIFRQSPLERRIRDLRVGSAHIMVGWPMWEAAGRVVLGRPAEMVYF